MILLKKFIMLIFLIIFFSYMLLIKNKLPKESELKNHLLVIAVIGLCLTIVSVSFDVTAMFINLNVDEFVSITFKLGAIIWAISTILWIDSIINIVCTLYKEAYTDMMTGLYNRKGIKKFFERKIISHKTFYIMVFDLDKTKLINDSLGHLIGDKYIINASKIIRDTIGIKGIIGRTGGDEFIAFLVNVNEKEIEQIKLSIKKLVSQIFSEYSTAVSIGYSEYNKDGKDFYKLVDIADKRMYIDKKKDRMDQRYNREFEYIGIKLNE